MLTLGERGDKTNSSSSWFKGFKNGVLKNYKLIIPFILISALLIIGYVVSYNVIGTGDIDIAQLVKPADMSAAIQWTNNNVVNFTCNVTLRSNQTIRNISLWAGFYNNFTVLTYNVSGQNWFNFTDYNWTLTLNDGVYNWSCGLAPNATSSYEYVNSTNYTIKIDTTKPFVGADGTGGVNVSPRYANFTSDQSPTVTVNLSDTTSGINLSTIVMAYKRNVTSTWSDGGTQSITAIDSAGKQYKVSIDLPGLPAGVVDIQVNVSDNATNAMDTFIWFFTIDTQAPAVGAIILKDTSGATINNNNLTNSTIFNITLTITDNTANFSTVTVNDSSTTSLNKSGDTWWALRNMSHFTCGGEGLCTFTVTATDQAANSNTSSFTVMIDNTRPSVESFTSNATNRYARPTDFVNFSATVTDTGGSGVSTVYLPNSSNLTTAYGSLYVNLTTLQRLGCPNDAWCSLIVYANDSAGNVNNTVNYSVYADNTAPSLSAFTTNGTTNSSKSTDTVNFTVTVTDAGSGIASVTLNGTAMTASGNTYYLGQTPTTWTKCPGEGTCVFTVTATDSVGNSGTISLNFIVDDTPPAVTSFTSNATNRYAKPTDFVNFTATVTDSGSGINIVYLPNSSNLTTAYGSLYVNLTTLQRLGCPNDAWCSLIVYANDSARNVNNTVNYSIYSDNTAPSVSAFVTNVTGNRSKPTDVINFNVTVTDSGSGVSLVQLNSTTMYLITGTNVYTANISPSTAGCQNDEGCNLTVNATDAVGNSATTSLTFTTDSTSPSVGVFTNLSIYAGAVNKSKSTDVVNISALVTDSGTGISSVTIANSSTRKALYAGSGSIYYNITSTPANYGCSEGSCIITVTATDNVSNSATATLTILVDDTAPTIAGQNPAEGGTTNSNTPDINTTITDTGSGVNVTSIVIAYNVKSGGSWGGWNTNITYKETITNGVRAKFKIPFALATGDTVNVSVNASDNVSNTNLNYYWYFTVDLGVTWSYNIYNNASTVTKINGVVNWTANLSDETGLSFAWLEHNATNINNAYPLLLVNESIITISGLSYNVSKQVTINVTRGNYTCGRFWFNDTSNNVNSTDWSCFTVANTAPATPASISPASGNQTTNSISLDCAQVGDADNDTVRYEIYGDTSSTPTTSLQNTTTNTYSWSLTLSSVYYYRCRAHDAFDNSASYTSTNYRYVDLQGPQVNVSIYNNASTVTVKSGVVNWTANVSDDLGLSFAWLEHNATNINNALPVLVNESIFSLGLSTNYNVSRQITINVTRANYTCGRFWFNDTLNNVNKTDWSCFTVANTAPTSPTTFSPGKINSTNNSETLSCSGSTDADADTINYEIYINSSASPTTLHQNSTTTTYTFAPDSSNAYYWRCRANDAYDVSSYSSDQEIYFDFIEPYTTVAIYNNASTTTKVSGVVNWTANVSDDLGLSFAWLEHNATNINNAVPALVNESIIALSGTNFNVSKQVTVNVSRANYTCGRFWFNDTLNNLNKSDWSCFTVANTPPPTPASVSPASGNQTTNGISLSCAVVTDADADNVYYEFYGDTSSTPTTKLQNTTTNTYTWTLTSGGVYYYRCRAHDAYDASASYTSANYKYVDFMTGTWTNVYNNASTVTKINGVVNWTANISDDMSLSFAWLEHNATNINNAVPALVNESIFNLGLVTNYNVSRQVTVNVTRGNYTCGRLWFNDTLNNLNKSDWSCFTVANTAPATPTTFSPGKINSTNNSEVLSCSGSADVDNDTIRYEFYINTSANPTSLHQNTTSTTYTFTPSAGGAFYWRCRANDAYDTSGYSSDQEIYFDFIEPYTTVATYNNASTVTRRNGVVNWTANISDDLGLSYAWLEENATTTSLGLPVLANQSVFALSGTNYNVSKQITVVMYSNNYTCARFWFNDTLNNLNKTVWSCFTVANAPPTMDSVSASPSFAKVGTVATISSVNANDEDNNTRILRCGASSGVFDLCNSTLGTGDRSCSFNSTWSGDAAHSVYCKLWDGEDYSSEKTTVVTADNTGPTFNILLPTFNQAVNSSSFNVVSDAADDGGGSQFGGVTSCNVKFTDNSGVVHSLGTISFDGSNCTGSVSIPSTASQGQGSLNVTLLDAVGNTGRANQTVTFTITDTTAPQISAINSPTSFADINAVFINVSTDENAYCRWGTQSLGYYYMNSYRQFTAGEGTTTHNVSIAAGNLSYGSNTLYVSCRDGAYNNMSTATPVTFTVLDLIAPNAPTLYGITAPTGGSREVRLAWSIVNDASYYKVYRNGTHFDTSYGNTSTNITFTPDDGGYSFNVSAVDAAGNENVSTQQTVVVDATAPEVISSSPSSSYLSTASPDLSVTTNENTTCAYAINDTAFTSMSVITASRGRITHDVDLGTLSDGAYQYYIKCNDSYANVMSSSSVISFYVNTTGNYNYTQSLSKGWNALWIPPTDVLTGMGWNTSLTQSWNITWALNSSLGTNYNLVYYNRNGTSTGWIYYTRGNWSTSELQIINYTNDKPYWINMSAADRFEI